MPGAASSRDGMDPPVGFATVDPRGLKFSWLDGLARAPGVGVFGPFGVAPKERGRGVGRALLGRALGALCESGYERAIVPAVGDERLARYYAEFAGAEIAERFDRAALMRPRRRTLVLASGNGSNFQAVIDAVRDGALLLDVVGLIANNDNAYAIERAKASGVSTTVVSWNRDSESRAAFDARLLAAAQTLEPDLVLLLGWMHLLSSSFVADISGAAESSSRVSAARSGARRRRAAGRFKHSGVSRSARGARRAESVERVGWRFAAPRDRRDGSRSGDGAQAAARETGRS